MIVKLRFNIYNSIQYYIQNTITCFKHSKSNDYLLYFNNIKLEIIITKTDTTLTYNFKINI